MSLNLRALTRAAAQFACEVTIYAAERVLEALAAERPLHDEPLPEAGENNHWPDELWTPPTIHPDYRPIYDRLISIATTDWPRPADPRSN